MKIRSLRQSILILLLFILAVEVISGKTSKDTVSIKSLWDSVDIHYKSDYNKTFFYLDSIQSYTLDRCQIDEYFKALKWSMQCAQDYHKLDLLHHYLNLGDNALQKYEHDLGDLKTKLEIDLKAFWASYYFKIASYSKAIGAHNEIIQELTQKDSLSLRDKQLIARSYQYLGSIQKLRGEFQEAIAHYWSSLDYVKEEWERLEKMGRIAFTYKQIGKCYGRIGDNRQAQLYNDKALSSLEKVYFSDSTDPGLKLRLKKNIIVTYNSISTFYLANGDSKKALEYLQKSLSYHLPNDTYLKSTTHMLGDVYASIDSFDTALHYYRISLEEKIKDYGEKNYSNALTYQSLGKLYAKKGEHVKAIAYYDQAIENLTTRPDLLEVLEEVDWNTIYAERALINVLNFKAKSTLQVFKQTQDSNYLHQSWTCTRTAILLIEETRINYHSEEDKQFLLKECYPIFEIAMHAGYLLGPDYYQDLFEIAEKSKAVLLVDVHQELNALQDASIPDSLLEKEKQYKAEISVIEDLINEENSKAEVNIDKIKSFYINLASAKQQYADLMTFLEERYIAEGQEKKRHSLLSDIQKHILKKDQSLIEYFLGDEHLFVLVIDRGQIIVRHIPVEFPLSDWIEQFQSGIYDYHLSANPSDSLFRHTQNLYTKYAWKLFEFLLEPVKDHLKQNLIIIPDGVLGYIPFEALLTDSVKNNSGNFADYPYVLKQYQLSYCYSASLLKTMKEKRYRSSGLLAFAPAFPKVVDPLPEPLALLRSRIDTLYHNIEEVELIKTILNTGTLKIGKEADKAAFMELAPQFKVIHIASHGILNDSISNNSYIAFYGGEDKNNRHNLLVKDLYKLRLETELVTLSACETGLGSLKRGEGIISLARGFAYAGSKSMLTTLWAVNDASTSQIMGSFYTHLSKGETKDGAIHQAKMDYIAAQSDPFEAHPFYWASYIAIGDMTPLYSGKSSMWLIGFLLLGIFFVGFRMLKR